MASKQQQHNRTKGRTFCSHKWSEFALTLSEILPDIDPVKEEIYIEAEEDCGICIIIAI